MAATPSLKFSFQTPYKGGTKQWSTKFHFIGGIPADTAAWSAFVTDVWGQLYPYLRDDQKFVLANGYLDDSSPAVFTEIEDAFGTSTDSGLEKQTAYVATLLAWSTDAHNARGGPIFLHNYLHGAITQSTDSDEVPSDQLTGLTAFAHRWSDAGTGFSDGTNTYKRAGPEGVAGLVGTCREFVSHRVLARRG